MSASNYLAIRNTSKGWIVKEEIMDTEGKGYIYATCPTRDAAIDEAVRIVETGDIEYGIRVVDKLEGV